MTAPAEFLGGDSGREVVQGKRTSLQIIPPNPKPDTLAAEALADLLRGPLSQIDWLNAGRSWRLAAAVGALRILGWPVHSEMVKYGRSRPFARYSLPAWVIAAVEERHG